MVRIYCRDHHGTHEGLCTDCSELLTYAQGRNETCPFGADKPVCNQCSVHCYSPKMRGMVKLIMRYAGTRMIWRHPVLALRHLARSFRASHS